MAKVTIEDISRDTGLSRGTVSRALNNKPDIAETTRERVLEACRKLNYVRNSLARSLATGKCYAVEMVVSDLTHESQARLVNGALSAADEAGYSLRLTEVSSEAGAAKLAHLGRMPIDGVFIGADLARVAAPPPALGGKSVVSCHPVPGVDCDRVAPDFVEAGRMSARRLLATGEKRLLFVSRSEQPEADLTAHGFHEVAKDGGARVETVVGEEISRLTRVLAEVRAAAASDDDLALRVLLICLYEQRVPGADIFIIGHGDAPCAAGAQLSSVALEREETGRRGVEALLERISHDRSGPSVETRVAPRLVARQSTEGGWFAGA